MSMSLSGLFDAFNNTAVTRAYFILSKCVSPLVSFTDCRTGMLSDTRGRTHFHAMPVYACASHPTFAATFVCSESMDSSASMTTWSD